MELAQWRTTTHLGSAQPLHRTLPPLTGSHVVTPDEKKTALVFDVSTGEHVVAFQHDTTILGIVYSPSGKFIATGWRDNKVYLWEAPAFVEELHRKVCCCHLETLPN
jgi:WD40 repeat protein